MRTITKVFISVLAVLVVALAGTGMWAYSKYADIKKDPAKAFMPQTSLKNTAPIEEKEQKKEIINVLLLGLDSNESRERRNKGYRSDAIIVCSINTGTNTITMLSIPRDTKADMNKLDETTGEVLRTVTNKINAAFALGGGPEHFGAKNSMDAVASLLSCDGIYEVPINYYVSIDMDGFGKMADAVDGVQVTLDMDLPEIGSQGETVMLKGSKALKYVRERHNVGNDYARAKRQQLFMVGFAKKVKEMGAASTAASLYDEFMQYGKTNMSLEQIIALASMLENVDLTDINYETVQGQTQRIDGLGDCEIPDMDKVKMIVENIFVPEVS